MQLTHKMVSWMAVGWKIENTVCYRKVHHFRMMLLFAELTISLTNGFQTNIERLKMCSSNTYHVSDLLKYRMKYT